MAMNSWRMRIWCVALAAVLPCLVLSCRASAEDAMEILREREEPGKASKVNLNYRQIRLEKVLFDMARLQPGVNIKVKAPTFQEEQELLARPVTLELTGVTWDVALAYVAERLKLIINRDSASDGVIYLEKVARFTDTFDGVKLGEAVREIAARGNANVIFSPLVQTEAPVYLSFTDVPWRDALESLLKAHGCTILSDGSGRIMRISTMAEADIQFETRSRPLRYVQPEGAHFQPEIVKEDFQEFVGRKSGGATDVGKSLLSVLELVKSEKGSVTYESRTNTLVLRDTPVKIQEMMKLVDEIDVPPQQVLIETRLLTVEENPSSRIGVKWGDDSGETYEGISGGISNGPSWSTAWPFAQGSNWGNLGNPLRPVKPGDNGYPTNGADVGDGIYTLGTMTLAQLKFSLQAAKYDDRIQLTQAPQILVLDNEEASVFIGNVRTYALAEQTQNDTSTSTSIEQKQILVGVQLFVIPHVCRGTDQIIMEIIPKETDNPVIGEVNAGNVTVDIPTRMNVKTVHTKMMLKSTETGVIAGLFRDSSNNQERAVPGLSKIPVIGKAFTHKTVDKSKFNSIILVTPTIIPPKHDEEFDRDVEAFRESLASSLR